MSLKTYEIDIDGCALRIRQTTTPASPYEYYPLSTITKIVPTFVANHSLRTDTIKRQTYIYEDKAEISIEFNDDSGHLAFDVQAVDNQATWNIEGGDNFFTGLLQALADINQGISDCAAGIPGGVPPAPVPTTHDPNLNLVVADGNTPANVHSFTIAFDGTGGTYDGAAVPDGGIFSYEAPPNGVLNAKAFTVPTAGAQSVLISDVT